MEPRPLSRSCGRRRAGTSAGPAHQQRVWVCTIVANFTFKLFDHWYALAATYGPGSFAKLSAARDRLCLQLPAFASSQLLML